MCARGKVLQLRGLAPARRESTHPYTTLRARSRDPVARSRKRLALGRKRSATPRATTLVMFVPEPSPSSFRRIAASMWGPPRDPSFHGVMDVDATRLVAFVDAERARTGKRVTITHVVASAVARAFADHPDLNTKVRLGGRIARRASVDVFVSVATDGGRDLAGAKIAGADRLGLGALVDAVEAGASSARRSQGVHAESRGRLAKLPAWALGPILKATDLLTNELDADLPGLGMPVDPFGTAIVTNVGSFGIDTAFAPFVPLGRAAMVLLIAEVKPRPWVEDGRIDARPVLRLCATFDHRLIDGSGAGRMARAIRTHLDAIAGGAS